jgi:serine/threonine protein kinase
MGEVYRARDTTLGREVALKTLPEDLARQPERLVRLRGEARILASLNHPGIATLHGLEESDSGTPVLVMELVAGESLAERLRRGALPVREAMTIAHQIALALEAAHEKGVLHRDLKPGNIRLAPEGRVKLLDFGLAKAVRKAAVDSRLDTETSPHSEPGTVLGTAPYMSPEQAKGEEADRRGDIWAFGCVLYEMLAAKRAFEGATSPRRWQRCSIASRIGGRCRRRRRPRSSGCCGAASRRRRRSACATSATRGWSWRSSSRDRLQQGNLSASHVGSPFGQ